MRHMKKILTVLLAAVMLICMSVSAVWAEGEEVAQQTTADNMSFDVIFAIDGKVRCVEIEADSRTAVHGNDIF